VFAPLPPPWAGLATSSATQKPRPARGLKQRLSSPTLSIFLLHIYLGISCYSPSANVIFARGVLQMLMWSFLGRHKQIPQTRLYSAKPHPP
jgi:hypothetical protein